VYYFVLAEIYVFITVLGPTQAPGLGHQPGDYTPGEKKYTTSDYIIPPKVSQITEQNLTRKLNKWRKM
jgi:hypothetical protein